MAATLRDLARFGLLFTKNPAPAQRNIITEQMLKRTFTGRGGPGEHGTLPLTYQWDMLSDQDELVKGGWAGQLLYVNREKDVVVAYVGTNQTDDPKLKPLRCRIIAKTFF